MRSPDFPVLNPQGPDDEMLKSLQRETLSYFINEFNPQTGLTSDSTHHKTPASVAVVGLGLSVYTTAIERGLMSRADAGRRILATLRFLSKSPQRPEPSATGYRGFFYHFLDMDSGERAWNSELSSIDTAILMAGVLTAAEFFSEQDQLAKEIRELAEFLYRRVEWNWMFDEERGAICHGWKPETGFLSSYWSGGYSEAMILYILSMGSPDFSTPTDAYQKWTDAFEWITAYDISYVYAGPMFIHQLSHIWLDFREIQDSFMRVKKIDYFENSRRATLVQQKYAIDNPEDFKLFSKNIWGFTASHGPGPADLVVDGRTRHFFGYEARGAPYGPNDGTVSPWAVVGSLPFAPRIVSDTARFVVERLDLKKGTWMGLNASFNPTYSSGQKNMYGWVSPWQYGLNQGPVVLMIENHFSDLIWRLGRKCSYIQAGLRRAGFQGGWLSALNPDEKLSTKDETTQKKSDSQKIAG